MLKDAVLNERRDEILALADKHGAQNVRIFGSIARGDFRQESDVDILVQMQQGRTFLDLVALWQELEELLGRKVDVITEEGISPYLRDRILAEAVPL
jgi:predicted nucleotidyltransferase